MRKKTDEEKAFDQVISIVIKEQRAKLRMSQEFISSHSGVSRITISKWEKGEKTPISFDLYNVVNLLYPNPAEFWNIVHDRYEIVRRPIHHAAEKEKFLNYMRQTSKKKQDKDQH